MLQLLVRLERLVLHRLPQWLTLGLSLLPRRLVLQLHESLAQLRRQLQRLPLHLLLGLLLLSLLQRLLLGLSLLSLLQPLLLGLSLLHLRLVLQPRELFAKSHRLLQLPPHWSLLLYLVLQLGLSLLHLQLVLQLN